MFRRERLMEASKDTVVVAARIAWGQYQRYSVYICQSGRAFEPVTYMAFYTDGEIKPYVAKLLEA